MTERDYDNRLEAQQVKAELSDFPTEGEYLYEQVKRIKQLQAENARLTELVKVQRELITWLEKKMSYFVTMRYLTGLDKEQHEGFRKKIRELEGV